MGRITATLRMLPTIFSRGCPCFSYIASRKKGIMTSIIHMAAMLFPAGPRSHKNSGTPTSAPAVKQNKKSDSLFWGMGYWTRSNVELCILATKGHPKRINAAVHQVIVSHIEEHSKKPQEARERIVSLMGDLPRIELFARQSTPGWDVWGNEVDSSISFP